MTEQNKGKLNSLERLLPEGLLVDAAWLTKHGYSTSLRSQYVSAGWLTQPVRGVYGRGQGVVSWQQVVISLQVQLKYPLFVGGRTALELQGFSHNLSGKIQDVYLYGTERAPSWLNKLPLKSQFFVRNSKSLFANEPVHKGVTSLGWQTHPPGDMAAGFTVQPWGQWEWPLTLSRPERAVLELLDELPSHESFHQVDKLIEGLSTLQPKLMQKMLVDCKSIKVKRLFFFFADRHQHTWLKYLDKAAIDLGSGKRMLVKGGKLDPTYQITVPEDLDAVE